MSPHLLEGIPVPLVGTVSMTLVPEGAPGTSCSIGGRAEDCSQVFSIQDGRLIAARSGIDGGSAAEAPLACTITGALDCAARVVVDGWSQCLYCAFGWADGGQSCAVDVGDRSAGTIGADYDAGALAFVNGTWNASEALAGNDGGSPGPDGGPPSAYLSDGGYIDMNYGGSGTWSATLQH
jgi:hypothetical protein